MSPSSAPQRDPAASAIQRLAALMHSVRFEDLSAEVVAAAEARIVDTLGCALGAVDSDVGRAVARLAADCGGAPQSTLIGTGGKTSAPLATFVNGSLLRYLDSNDYYFARDPAHPSGNIAVALAVGERMRTSGRELIAALVGAYEIHLRLCDFAGEPSLWRRGWHHATNAQFSSAALASRLLGDGPDRTAHAMAIAASHQNTLAQLQSGSISMIKGTAEAWVAKAGVEAALLAHYGMTGPLAVIEGAAGWSDTVAGTVDIEALCAPIEGRYRLVETSLKAYPAVATAGAPIGAAITLHRAGLPPLDEIARMVVRLPAFALGTPSAHPSRRVPAEVESAQHSFYFCAAVALLDGACGKAQFTASKLADPSLRGLLAKVDLVEDTELTALWPGSAGGGVELHLRDGRTLVQRCPYPPGHPRHPLTDAELAAKFHGYADPVLGADAARALRDASARMSRCADVSDVARLFVVPTPAHVSRNHMIGLSMAGATTTVSVPTSLREFVDPATTALVMWDMQKGLAGKAANIETVSRNAAALLASAERAGILVIWSRHILPPLDLTVGPFLLFLMRKQGVDHPSKLRPFMQRGTEETEFLPGFAPAPHHVVLEKSMPSLFVDTPLDLRLKARRIGTIVLAGVATDIGIEFTARHAVASGYYPVVAEDATGAYSQANHDRSISFIREWTPVVPTQAICEIWDEPRP